MSTRESNEDGGERRVRSLRDLPQSIAPPEGLWGRIASQIDPALAPVRTGERHPPLRAVAAILLALIAGALLGRWFLPAPGREVQLERAAAADMLPASFISDPRYLQQRAALLSGLQAQLAAMPPQAREEVLESLETIQRSMRELRTALGRDPSNALLQELLVDTCQDEMRVLVSVHEAGEAGKGI
jgi:hypothetical protein